MTGSDLFTSSRHTVEPNPQNTYSVGELNREVKRLLESSYPEVWVRGEISNLATPTSGHVYFSLKDDKAQIRCALFRQRRYQATITPTDGLEVLLRGQVSIYEGRGDYQFIVHYLEQAGEGALRRQFELLKKKLSKQGLFDSEHKQALPEIPHHVGVITSATGAAIRDILSTLKRRAPMCPVMVYPSIVQGPEAAKSLCEMLRLANKQKCCDVLILSRGGGSLEDLGTFNDENLAKEIFRSDIPIVSGIGHEIDFTIADFVADFRAATPTAAAEAVSPDQEQLAEKVAGMFHHMVNLQRQKITDAEQDLDWFARRLTHPRQLLGRCTESLRSYMRNLSHVAQMGIRARQLKLSALRYTLNQHSPALALAQNRHRLHDEHQKLHMGWGHFFSQVSQRHKLANARLAGVSHQATLLRGYAILRKRGNKTLLRSPKETAPGDIVDAQVAKGKMTLVVDEV